MLYPFSHGIYYEPPPSGRKSSQDVKTARKEYLLELLLLLYFYFSFIDTRFLFLSCLFVSFVFLLYFMIGYWTNEHLQRRKEKQHNININSKGQFIRERAKRISIAQYLITEIKIYIYINIILIQDTIPRRYTPYSWSGPINPENEKKRLKFHEFGYLRMRVMKDCKIYRSLKKMDPPGREFQSLELL